MKKLFTFLAAALMSVSVFAAKDVVPSDAVLAQYYNQGDVCVCFYVSAEMNCNNIVLTGSFNGWKSTAAECVAVEPVEGYDGWYVGSFEAEAEPDGEKGMQAKPIMLDVDGNFSWDYQVGAATVIRGGVQVVQGAYVGEIDMINYGADAPNVFTVDAWKQNPCTAIYHNYTVTVINDGCNGLTIPFIVGGMTKWVFQEMQLDMAKTQEYQTPVYNYSFKAAEGTAYQIVSGMMDPQTGKVDSTALPGWMDIAYMQKLVDEQWVRLLGEEDDNQLTHEEANIVWDLRSDSLRWARCAPAEPDEYTVFAVNLPVLNCPQAVEIIGTFDDWAGTAMEKLNTGWFFVELEAKASQYFKFRSAGSWEQQLEYYDAENDEWKPVQDNQFVFGQLWQDDTYKGTPCKWIELDLSDPEKYRWSYSKTVHLATVANYIDFQALSVSDPQMIQSVVTSTNPYTLPNGTVLRGFQKSDGTEAENKWNVTEDYTRVVPTPEWEGVDSLKAGTAYRAASRTTIELGAFNLQKKSQLIVYFQPNGDSERGVSVSINGGEPIEYTRSGVKIDGIRPAYAAPFDLPAGNYDAGDVVITLVVNTSNILGIGIQDVGYTPEPIAYTGTAKIDGINYYLNGETLSAGLILNTNDYGDYIHYSGDIVIPDSVTYDGFRYCVTEIGVYAFENCTELTSVTIPNTVTTIYTYAFRNCTALTSIEIPNSVTSIGDGAFYGCAGLTSVTIGNSVTSIEYNAFRECSSLTSIEIPNSVTSIGNYAFSNCTALTSVTIPNSVTSIGDYAFYECSGLTSVTIGNSVTSIGEYAFEGCSGLTSVTIPNSVTSIGDGAFAGCRGLTSVTIGNSVTSIGESAFYNCSGLTSVTIGNSVTYIGYDAFYSCNNLKTITVLGETPAEIGYEAFGYYWDMQAVIYVPCGTKETYQSAWGDYANRIQYLPKTYDYALYTLVNDGEMGYVTLPASVCEEDLMTAMPYEGYYFVRWADGVTTNPRPFVLTKDTTFTAEFAMTLSGKCGKDLALTWIYVPETKTLTISGNGELIENYTFRTAAQKAENIVLNEGMTAIGSYAFEGCSNVKAIVVPASVTLIGERAFRYCDSLQSFIVLNADAELAYGVLSGCRNLQYIEAPTYSMAGFTPYQLKEVKFTGGIMYSDYFYSLAAYNTLQAIDLSKTTVEAFPSTSFFANFRALKTLILPTNLTEIEYALAADCYYLDSIAIPAGVTEIGDRAFEDCRSLAKVEFAGTNLQRIGDWAFYNCHELSQINLPEGVTEIGKAAFYGCVYANQAYIPASVQAIGDNAFALCSKLSKMIVDAVVPPTVEDKTFYEVSTTAPVYVPANSVEDYKSHPVWGKLNIIGNAPEGVENVQSDQVQCTKVIENGVLYLKYNGTKYNVQGTRVK